MDKNQKSIVFLFIVLHLCVTLPLAYILNAWVDETSTLYNTQRGIVETFQNVFHTEKQAPLYFLLLSLWRSLDASIFFARLFSIICSCLAIKFFYDLASHYFDSKIRILLTAFFSLHPYLIWASLEIRLYSMAILLSVLLLKFFSEGYLDQENPEKRKRSQILFVITAIFSLCTNYYLGFVLAGGFASLVLTKRWKLAQTYIFHMFAVGLAIAPLIWVIKMQLAINTGGYKEEIHLIDGIKTLWGHFLTFTFPTELLTTDKQTGISFARVWIMRILAIGILLILIKSRFRHLDEKFVVFASISFCTSAFLLFAFLLLGGEYISLRHASVLFVSVVLMVAAVLANLLPAKGWMVLALLFPLLFPYSVYMLYPTLAKRGDWHNVARFIEQNEKPGQPIIFSQAYDAISLPIHYKGVNRVLPDERFFEWNLEDSQQSENAFRKEMEFIISKIPKDATEIWLLTHDACHIPETAPSCRPLENFVEANYTIEIEKDFYLERVRLLKKK